jgi:hypothetical protein
MPGLLAALILHWPHDIDKFDRMLFFVGVNGAIYTWISYLSSEIALRLLSRFRGEPDEDGWWPKQK